MDHAPLLAKAFRRNQLILEAQTEGLTHADSLAQAPFAMNCLNWVLGHIAVSRDEVLAVLGEGPVLAEEEAARYLRDSDPVTGDGPGVLPLERLLVALKEGQERISAAVGALPEEAFDEEQLWGERSVSRGARLHFHLFHDTYHVGQTELLRAVAGKTDKVI